MNCAAFLEKQEKELAVNFLCLISTFFDLMRRDYNEIRSCGHSCNKCKEIH